MMKQTIARPRAALLIGAAFLATPAFAQDAPVVTPPPIMVAPPAAAPAAPAPAPRVIQMQPQAPVVQQVPERPAPVADAEAPAPRARAAARPAPARTVTRQTVRQTAPAAAAPAAVVAQPTAPSAPVPVDAAPVAQAPVAEPAAPAEVATTTTTETTSNGGAVWPWLLGGLLLVIAGAAAFLLMRRRRDDEEVAEVDYVEEYVEPVAVESVVVPRSAPIAAAYAAPVAAAPSFLATTPAETTPAEAHVEAELVRADSDELAGVADAEAPVSNRPWLEFGLRPVRAGTSEEEAVVDVELTVGNSGDIAANNVRISTFMLADSNASEMESLLAGHRSDTVVPPVTIQPGDGTRVDAHLAVPKGEMGRTFNPVVFAEARYTLADGSEGRTSAAFKIGHFSPDHDGVTPIAANRPHMVDTVDAELLGTPEHA